MKEIKATDISEVLAFIDKMDKDMREAGRQLAAEIQFEHAKEEYEKMFNCKLSITADYKKT